MNAAMLACGAAVGAGIALIVRGWAPPAPALSDVLAELHRPRGEPAGTSARDDTLVAGGGWSARCGRPAARWLASTGVLRARLPKARIQADLELLERPVQVHVAEQVTLTVLGVLIGPVVATALALAGLRISWALPAAGCLLLGAAGFLTPDLITRKAAAARRAEFTHALGTFLDLVAIGLAGGAGVEAALAGAARTGRGWSFDRLRHALQAAEITRITPWAALGNLADALQVPVLREVAATVGLAGTEGAKVRVSLAAKTSGMRLRELTTAEADAVAATERMSIPVIVMFAGFLLFIGYPAVTHVFTAL